MRRGFSLTELMLVLAVTGLLLGIAIPHLATMIDQIEVRSAATHLVTAHQRARMMAVARGQVLVLTIAPTMLDIRTRGGTATLWAEQGPAATRVSLQGPAKQFIFSPEGLTLGLSNATLRLSRGEASRTVVISRLGRARMLR